MTHLYVIRHGAYTATTEGGFRDGGLSPQGKAQAQRLRDRLATTGEIRADVLIASPALRAEQTAEIIAPALGLPIVLDNDIQEWHNGEGHALSGEEFIAELKATPYSQRSFWKPAPGNENWAEFMFRACTAINRITQQHAGKNIALVCHGGIVEASFLFFYGFSPLQPSPVMMLLDPAYTSITHWRKISGLSFEQWMLVTYNDAMHLRDDLPHRPVG